MFVQLSSLLFCYGDPFCMFVVLLSLLLRLDNGIGNTPSDATISMCLCLVVMLVQLIVVLFGCHRCFRYDDNVMYVVFPALLLWSIGALLLLLFIDISC